MDKSKIMLNALKEARNALIMCTLIDKSEISKNALEIVEDAIKKQKIEIKIEKEIPVPYWKSLKLEGCNAETMEIGDSIFVPVSLVGKTCVRKHFGIVGQFRGQFKCSDDVVKGESGVRVWRLK